MNGATMTTVLSVSDMRTAVAAWRSILGVEPTLVDGERWAQFNLGAMRIALAGADQAARAPALMIKTSALEEELSRLGQSGAIVSTISEGAHERYFEAQASDGWRVTYYQPR